ncbi:MAG: hypothetical protein PHG67_13540 [Bacteroidales bacterium]|nr:hypothetical protein [Bacteroidales bacterium]
MKEFDDLKTIWSVNQTQTKDTAGFLGKKKSHPLSYLKKQYALSTMGLFASVVFILWFGFLSGKEFTFEISYTALALLAVSLFVILFVNIYNVFLISKLDETLAPKEYLNHWRNFYKKRLRFFSVYAPVISIILCLSFLLYVPEIIGYYPNIYYKTEFVFFLILVFFVSYILGKNASREEKIKLNELNEVFNLLSKS